MSLRFVHVVLLFAASPLLAADYTVSVQIPDCGALIAASDPETADVSTVSQLGSAVADPAKRIICVRPGDYTSAQINLYEAGSGPGVDDRRYLVYYSPTDAGLHPVDQAPADRAQLWRLYFREQADYWVVHRLSAQSIVFQDYWTFVAGNGDEDGPDHNILDNVYVGHDTPNPSGVSPSDSILIMVRDNSDNNTIQKSVIRNAPIMAGQDSGCIKLATGSQHTRIVGNEIYNCSDEVQIESAVGRLDNGANEGTIIADNDLYVEGPYLGCSENAIDIKSACASDQLCDTVNHPTTASSDNWLKIIGNRMWGMTGTSTNICDNELSTTCTVNGDCPAGGVCKPCGGTGDPGSAIVLNSETLTNWVLIQNNIIKDSGIGVIAARSAPRNITVAANLFENLDQGIAFQGKGKKTESYLNAIVNSDPWYYSTLDTNSDFRCNSVIDSGSASLPAACSGTSPAYDLEMNYNSYVNSTAPALSCPVLQVNYLSPPNPAPPTADYCYERKRFTGPETDSVADGTAIQLISCPSSALLGSLTDRGVDDSTSLSFFEGDSLPAQVTCP